jgi:hypothetical protein
MVHIFLVESIEWPRLVLRGSMVFCHREIKFGP